MIILMMKNLINNNYFFLFLILKYKILKKQLTFTIYNSEFNFLN